MKTASSSRVVEVHCDTAPLSAAITAIRNAYVAPADRRPLRFHLRERRSGARLPLSVPVRITGAVYDDCEAKLFDGDLGGELVDISLRGLAFVHVEPFPGFHALVQVALPEAKQVALFVKLVAMERESPGRYRTGAELVGLVDED